MDCWNVGAEKSEDPLPNGLIVLKRPPEEEKAGVLDGCCTNAGEDENSPTD